MFSGASFYNATDAASFCVSGNMINTLTCTALTCGDPKLDPDGNPVPDLIVNGDDADIEAWRQEAATANTRARDAALGREVPGPNEEFSDRPGGSAR